MDEKIKTAKKQWQKPELIVLVRGRPEEAVLLRCKNIGIANTDATPHQGTNCFHDSCSTCRDTGYS